MDSLQIAGSTIWNSALLQATRTSTSKRGVVVLGSVMATNYLSDCTCSSLIGFRFLPKVHERQGGAYLRIWGQGCRPGIQHVWAHDSLSGLQFFQKNLLTYAVLMEIPEPTRTIFLWSPARMNSVQDCYKLALAVLRWTCARSCREPA